MKRKKTILVACEYSGIVRDAFENAGWDAWSCDIIPTESEQTKQSGKHLQIDARKILHPNRYLQKLGIQKKWDMLIAFPPCTYTSFAYTGKERYSNDRLQRKLDALQFFLDLWSANIEHICLENPMGFVHSGLLPATQIIEPFYFGHDYRKRTCLWLKNLPPLKYNLTDTLFEKRTAKHPTKVYLDNTTLKKRAGRECVLKPLSSAKKRSKFHTKIAEAMAEQWTEFFDVK